MISVPTAAERRQRSQRIGSIARMREQVDDHRADRRHRGAGVALDQREDRRRVPARQHHDCGTVAQATIHVAGHPGHVKIRQHRHDAAARRAADAPHRSSPERGLQAAVRVHAAFGASRCAGGVRQQRHVVAGGHHRAGRLGARERFVPSNETVALERGARRGHGRRQAQIGRIFDVVRIRRDDDRTQRRGNVRAQTRGQLLSGDCNRRAAILEEREQLFGDEHRVERHDHCVGA